MSSNDSGDDARGKPPASARPRQNRPLSTAQRVREFPETGDDPREDVLSKRPQPGPRPVNTRRPTGNDDVPRAKSARHSSNGHATGNSNGNGISNSTGTNGSAPSNGGAPLNRHSANGSSGSKPNGMIASQDQSSRAPAPVTRPVSAVDAAPTLSTALSPAPPMPLTGSATRTGPATRIDPGMMPAPAGLIPSRLPKAAPLPALFDHESTATGPIPFDRLFDTDQDPSGAVHAPRAPRQRTMMFTQTGRRSRPRIRRVTRVVRHVDPWSVFKVALCFSIVLYGVCLTAGVLLWNVAYTTGTIDNVQRFFESFGWDTFRFKGGELFHNAWIAGLFASLGLTGLIVLTATLFNLITDLVGGIRVTVLEEEVVERNPVVRGPLLRRRTRPVTGIIGESSRREGYPDDGDSMDSPLPFG